MDNDSHLASLKEWVAQLRSLLKLSAAATSRERQEQVQKALSAMGAKESPLPDGVKAMLGDIAGAMGAELPPADRALQQQVDEARQKLNLLLVELMPVMTSAEVDLQDAWLQLSSQSCLLRKYELALKTLESAWVQAQAIAAEKRGAAVVAPVDSPLRALAEEALKTVGALGAELDMSSPDLQLQFALLATATHKALSSGSYGTALGLAAQWHEVALEAIKTQGQARSAALRRRIEDEVYTPNSALQKLEVPRAAVPHSDTQHDLATIPWSAWATALAGVEQDIKTVTAALARAREDVDKARISWGEERSAAAALLERLKLAAPEATGTREGLRLQAAEVADLAPLGMRRLAAGIATWQTLAAEWLGAAQAGEAAKGSYAKSEADTRGKLDAVSREAPAERKALDLLLAAAQKLAAERDWTGAVAQLEACRRTADEKIKAQRDGVRHAVGTNCEAAYLDSLLDKLGAVEAKKLADGVGAKVLGDLSKQFSVDELDLLRKEAGDAKGIKTLLDDIGGGKAAELKTLRTTFGSLAPLQSAIKDGFGGKAKTVGSLLKTGFGGDAGKLKTFLDAYPTPDPALLQAKNPAALKAQKDQQNLTSLLNQGGLNDNPEVFAHLVGTGCAGDPAKLKELHAQFTATTPPGLAGMKALLDVAGLKIPPERLADILKTGCAGSAINLKELTVGFNGKMAQLKEVTTQWGADSGAAIKGLTDARHLQGDYRAVQQKFTQTLNDRYPGAQGRQDREFMIRAAPKFKRAIPPDNINTTLDEPFELGADEVGSFGETNWDHLMTHICERHSPSSFAFKDAKAAQTPINFSNSQFPADWTAQDIATLMKEALLSTEGQKALARSEAYADAEEAVDLHRDWVACRNAHAYWTAKQAYLTWWNGGGNRWSTYQNKLKRGERWSGPIPANPGDAPPWPGRGWDLKTGAGPEPARPGAEPPNPAPPVWKTESFEHGHVLFQIGVGFRKGKRQIVQYAPVESYVGGPKIEAFSGYDMEALRDAMTQ